MNTWFFLWSCCKKSFPNSKKRKWPLKSYVFFTKIYISFTLKYQLLLPQSNFILHSSFIFRSCREKSFKKSEKMLTKKHGIAEVFVVHGGFFTRGLTIAGLSKIFTLNTWLFFAKLFEKVVQEVRKDVNEMTTVTEWHCGNFRCTRSGFSWRIVASNISCFYVHRLYLYCLLK